MADTSEATVPLLGGAVRTPVRSKWRPLDAMIALICALGGVMFGRSFGAPRQSAGGDPAHDAPPTACSLPPGTLGGPYNYDCLPFATWPEPMVALSKQTTAALGLDRPGPLDAPAVARRMHDETRRREAAGEPTPALLVLGGRDWAFGLGNVLEGLVGAAVVAEAIGAACVVTLGHSHFEIHALSRDIADPFPMRPCRLVTWDEFAALSALPHATMPIVHWENWTAGDAAGDAGPFILKLESYRQLGPTGRSDVHYMYALPAMSPGQYWPRVREKYERFFFGVLRTPVLPAEDRVQAPKAPWDARGGTICGHIRLLKKEARDKTHARLPFCDKRDCGNVLEVMESLHSVRPFPSFLVASGDNCTHCLPINASRLSSHAEHLATDHISARITMDLGPSNRSVHDEEWGLADVRGAVQDLRSLARCSIIVVDDKAGGTYAAAAALAGGLAHCPDPVAWLRDVWPAAAAVDEGRLPHIPVWVHNGPHARVLCHTRDKTLSPMPTLPPSGSLEGFVDAHIRGYDVSTPWRPRRGGMAQATSGRRPT